MVLNSPMYGATEATSRMSILDYKDQIKLEVLQAIKNREFFILKNKKN